MTGEQRLITEEDGSEKKEMEEEAVRIIVMRGSLPLKLQESYCHLVYV